MPWSAATQTSSRIMSPSFRGIPSRSICPVQPWLLHLEHFTIAQVSVAVGAQGVCSACHSVSALFPLLLGANMSRMSFEDEHLLF